MRILLFILIFLVGNIKAQSPLCSSYPSNFCCEYVSSVTINGKQYNGSTGFSSNSGGTGPNGYYDYTGNAVPTIKAGQQISISYTAKTNSNYREYFKLWFDFNGNGDLSDAGELVHNVNYTWSGTKTVTATFTVPTSVYNGTVYMRFMMVYSSVPKLCGSYAYGNTFDFKTTITGATDPFSYSGYIKGSEEDPIENIPVKLYSKAKSSSSGYSYESTTNTDSTGYFKLTSKNDASLYDFKLEIINLTIPNPTTTDATFFNQKILIQSFNSKDYYRMDVNNNDKFNISDVYLIYQKINNIGWKSGIPYYRIFTKSEFDTLSSTTSKPTNNGVQTYIKSSLNNKDSMDFYIIRTGYSN